MQTTITYRISRSRMDVRWSRILIEKRIGGSGRPKIAAADENIAAVDDLIQSQEENGPGTHLSQRQIAREIGISQSSVGRISKNILNVLQML